VHHSFDADVFFPEIDPEVWELISETFNPKDEKHLFDYTFQKYSRKK
jgi:dihydrofolate reductase